MLHRAVPKLNRLVLSTYPKTVQLTNEVHFEADAPGATSGPVTAPKGAIVKLLSVQKNATVVIEYLGYSKMILRSWTDLDTKPGATPNPADSAKK